MKTFICIVSFLVTCIPQSVLAENPTAIFNVVGRVVSRTCVFDETQQTVHLPDIATNAFRDNTLRGEQRFSVGITCGSGVSSVEIVANGKADIDDQNAFANTGDSSGIALRLLSEDGEVMLPDGTKSITVTPDGLMGRQVFRAGYIATQPGSVTAGSFEAMVTLTFDYS